MSKELKKAHVSRSNPLRKKRINGRCCCCNPIFMLVAPIVTIVIVIAAMFGGVYFAYETWGKEYTGLELSQVWGLGKNALSNLSQEEIDRLVVNRYSAEDLKKFYTNFKNAAYIKDDCDIDFVDIIMSVLKPSDVAEGADQSQQNPLSGIVFDAEKIKADLALVDNGEPYVPKTLMITDKQVGSLVNDILKELLFSAPQEGETASSLNSILSAETLSLEQVIINNFESKENTTFEMTICITLRTVLKTFISEMEMPAIAKSAVDLAIGMLPEKLYVSANLKPYHLTGDIGFLVNKMTDEDTANLLKLFDTLSEKTGNPSLNINNLLNDLGAKVYEVFSKIDEFVALDFVTTEGDNGMKIEPIDALLRLLKLSGEDGVTEEDLMRTLKAISLVDTSKIVSEINKFDPTDIDKLNAQIKNKFPLNKDYNFDISNIIGGNGLEGLIDNVSLKSCADDFFEKGVDESTLLFSGKDFGGLIDSLLKSKLGTQRATDDVLSKLKPSLEQTAIKKDAIVKNKYSIYFTISVNIKTLLIQPPVEGEAEKSEIQKMLDNLIDEILPEKTYLTAEATFTVDAEGRIIHKLFEDDPNFPNANPDAQKDITKLALNNLDFVGTENMVNLVSKILSKISGGDENPFDLTAITADLDKTLRTALRDIESSEFVNGMRLGFVTDADGKSFYRIPGIYEIVQKVAKVNEVDSVNYVSAEEIHAIFKKLFSFGEKDYVKQNYSTDLSNINDFFDLMNNGLFFNKLGDGSYPLSLRTLFGIGGNEGEPYGFEVITNSLKLPGAINFRDNENGLYLSKKMNEELRSRLKSNAFAELIYSTISKMPIVGLKNTQLVYSFLSTKDVGTVSEVYIHLGLSASVDMPSAEKYMPDMLFVEVSMPFNPNKSDADEDITKKSSISIAKLADSTENIFKLINGFTGGEEGFTYEGILKQLVTVVSDITKNLNNEALSLSFETNSAEQTDFERITGVTDGTNKAVNLVLPSIYDFMTNIIIKDKMKRPEPDDLRVVLQTFNTYTYTNTYDNSQNEELFKSEIVTELKTIDMINYKYQLDIFMTDLALKTRFNDQLKTNNPIDFMKNPSVNCLEIKAGEIMDMVYNFGINPLNGGDYTELMSNLIPKEIVAHVKTDMGGASSSEFSINGLNQQQIDLLFDIINANKANPDDADITYDGVKSQVDKFSGDTLKGIEDGLAASLPSQITNVVNIDVSTELFQNSATPLVYGDKTYYGNGNSTDGVGDRGGYIKFILTTSKKG